MTTVLDDDIDDWLPSPNPAPAKPKRRRIVQVALAAAKLPVPFTYIVARCDDGTMWAMEDNHGWVRLPDIPQDEEEITK